MNKQHYNVRWHNKVNLVTVANVDIYASHDTNAKRMADKIGRELGHDNANTGRMIYCDGKLVE